MAHKKSGSSSVNGRDSAGRRLGAKKFDGQKVSAGSILMRQRGTKIFPGNNVGRGGDDTLFAKIDGIVKFERKGKTKRQISIYAGQTGAGQTGAGQTGAGQTGAGQTGHRRDACATMPDVY